MAHKAKFFVVTLMLFVALSFSFERQAHAYVDPGSSLLLFQSFSAVVSGVLFYFRRRIKTLFTRTEKSPAPSASINSTAAGPR